MSYQQFIIGKTLLDLSGMSPHSMSQIDQIYLRMNWTLKVESVEFDAFK